MASNETEEKKEIDQTGKEAVVVVVMARGSVLFRGLSTGQWKGKESNSSL